MSLEAPTGVQAKVRKFGHGAAEIISFLAASAWAFLEVCMGRWPGAPERRRRRARRTKASDKVA
jgi:hypothetical protein